jgi:heme exporter protein A
VNEGAHPNSPGAPGGEPAVRAADLWRAYGDTWALRGIDLELARGEDLALIGANGAGKSTLLRMLAGLLRPTEGSLEVLGCELPKQAWKLRARLGYLGHQNLLYRDLTAAENLRFHARLFGLPGDGGERIDALLRTVGLEHRAGSRVAEMSAGMAQRLAICRTVLHEPEILLLDEPVAHLDPAGSATVEPLIGPAPGRTRVVVTHDVAAARAGAGRILALRRDGEVAYFGPASGFGDETERAVFAERAPGVPGAVPAPSGGTAR